MTPRRRWAGLVATTVATVATVAFVAPSATATTVLGASAPTAGGPTAVRHAPVPPCGTEPSPPKHWAHVIWIMMENTDYDQLVGSRAAPFINSLIARCGLATNYHAITHPSLPNYIGPVAGFGPTRLRPYDADCHPTGDCLTSAPSLFSQVPTWKAYQESMTKNCQRANDYPYYANGNPPMYFTSLAGCGKFDVPYRRLRADLVANTLPAFSWVTPNVCHQMHDCRIPVGDRWLRAQLAVITASGSYRAGRTALFITWDEGYHWVDYHCLGNTTDPGCHMATIVVSASTPAGTTSNAYFDHYSLLRTTEEMLGVITYLGRAAGAASMRDAFGL